MLRDKWHLGFWNFLHCSLKRFWYIRHFFQKPRPSYDIVMIVKLCHCVMELHRLELALAVSILPIASSYVWERCYLSVLLRSLLILGSTIRQSTFMWLFNLRRFVNDSLNGT